MATFVLVHGGGHGGWCYQPVARLLQKQGHEVYRPTLTGLGEREHLLSSSVDLEMHITDVVKLLEFEDLQDVILAGHSYGGMVVSGVADRATSRIGNLVYLDAAYPMDGQSLSDVAGDVIDQTRKDGKIVNGMELVLYPGKDPMHYFGVTDPEQIAWMKPKLTPHPWKCFEQKLVFKNENAVRALPQSFVTTNVQKDLLTDEIRAMVNEMTNGRFWEVDTGHDLMISEPEQLAQILVKISEHL